MVTTVESNTSQLVATNMDSAINIISTHENRTNKRVGSNSGKVDNINIIKANSIEFIKSVNWLSLKFCYSQKKLGTGFFISGARVVFIKLRQIFIETLILHYFDPEYHIEIETNIFHYTISEILS